MNKHFSYSILQYKHSISLGEILNVGILFHFPESNLGNGKLYFVYGNGHRAKSIYPNFNNSLFNVFLKTINNKIISANNLFQDESLKNGLRDFIHKNILAEDASALQFSEPNIVTNVFNTNEIAIKTFSEKLLPGIVTEKPLTNRISETLIIKKYKSYVFENHKDLEKKIVKNKEVKDNDVNLKFDFAWKNGSLNLVKPLSFDLNDAQSIQQKAVTYFGYLNLLDDYAKDNNCRFDFIVAKPRTSTLFKSYDKAIDILGQSIAPKRIIFENEIENYSEETINGLLSH